MTLEAMIVEEKLTPATRCKEQKGGRGKSRDKKWFHGGLTGSTGGDLGA